MDSTKIGAYIAGKRKGLGLSQQALADRLGVTNKAVSKWECGDGFPDITLLPALAGELRVTTDELLEGEDKAPTHQTVPAAGNSFSKAKNQFQTCAILSLLPAILFLILSRISFFLGYVALSWWITVSGMAISFLFWLVGWFRLKARAGGTKLFPVTGPWLAAGLWFWCLPSIPLLQYLLYLIKVFATGQISDSGVGFWEGGAYIRILGSTLITYAVLMILVTVIICLWAKHMKKEPSHD